MPIAVITGASSGLGAEFARQLDNEGLETIWLIARRRDRMESLAKTLKTPTRILDLDLFNRESFTVLSSALNEKSSRVQWWINNAGFGRVGAFAELPVSDSIEMIELNVTALVALSHLAVKHMPPGSHLVQLASTAAFQPLPGMAIYAATKAFVLSFSEALSVELKAKGISVTSVCPGPVQTEFFDVASIHGAKSPLPQFMFTKSPRVVQRALKHARAGRRYSFSHLPFVVMSWVGRFTPRWLLLALFPKTA